MDDPDWKVCNRDYPFYGVLKPGPNKSIRPRNGDHVLIVVLAVGIIFAVLAFL